MRKTIEVIATSKNSTKIRASPAINFHSHSVSFFFFLFSFFQFKRKKRHKRKGSNKVKTLRRLVIFAIHNTNKHYYVCVSVSCNFCNAPIWLSDSLFLGLEMLASCSPSDDCLVLMFQIFTNSQFENHTS